MDFYWVEKTERPDILPPCDVPKVIYLVSRNNPLTDVPVCSEDRECPFMTLYGGRVACLKQMTADTDDGSAHQRPRMLSDGEDITIVTNHCSDKLVKAGDLDRGQILRRFLESVSLIQKH